jgi:hypothetical protein
MPHVHAVGGGAARSWLDEDLHISTRWINVIDGKFQK